MSSRLSEKNEDVAAFLTTSKHAAPKSIQIPLLMSWIGSFKVSQFDEAETTSSYIEM